MYINFRVPNCHMVVRAMCVMYYGRSCARNETRPDVARKQHGNYRSVARTIPVNFLMTYTVCIYVVYLFDGTPLCLDTYIPMYNYTGQYTAEQEITVRHQIISSFV